MQALPGQDVRVLLQDPLGAGGDERAVDEWRERRHVLGLVDLDAQQILDRAVPKARLELPALVQLRAVERERDLKKFQIFHDSLIDGTLVVVISAVIAIRTCIVICMGALPIASGFRAEPDMRIALFTKSVRKKFIIIFSFFRT